jgi:hypothetical protein
VIVANAHDKKNVFAAVEFSVANVIGSKGLSNQFPLRNAQGQNMSILHVQAMKQASEKTPRSARRKDVYVDIEISIPKLNVQKRPDPFLQVAVQCDDDENSYIPLYTSEFYVQKKGDREVSFRPFSLQMDEEEARGSKYCSRVYKFELFYWDQNKGFKSCIGHRLISSEQLLLL